MLRNLLMFLGGLVAMSVLVTFGDPYVTAYGVKTAARNSCPIVIRNARFNTRDDYATEFMQRAALKGVRLTKEQFAFKAEPYVRELTWVENKIEGWGLYQFPRPPPSFMCSGVATWKTEIPVFMFGDLLGIKPMQRVERVEFEWVVKNSY
jgi:hypothetical protein